MIFGFNRETAYDATELRLDQRPIAGGTPMGHGSEPKGLRQLAHLRRFSERAMGTPWHKPTMPSIAFGL
jgi:hypothetical protein